MQTIIQLTTLTTLVTSSLASSVASNNALPCGAMDTNSFCQSSGGDEYFCGYVNQVSSDLCPYPSSCSKVTNGASEWPQPTSVSFLNINDKSHDMLTIPLSPVQDITKMCGSSNDKATALSHLLYDGRKYASEILGINSNFAQCYHLPGSISVYWMHQHTFNAAIPSESFNCVPGFNGCPLYSSKYTCVASNDPDFSDTYAMAQKLLSHA
eukprot:Pgem_evm1s19325